MESHSCVCVWLLQKVQSFIQSYMNQIACSGMLTVKKTRLSLSDSECLTELTVHHETA